MKPEKLKSGSYRVRRQKDGKTYTFLYDHKPTKREMDEDFIEAVSKSSVSDDKTPFRVAADRYIELKRNVLSPSTIVGYKSAITRLSDEFCETKICDIGQVDVQKEINKISATKSPKTVRNIHGFISAVLRLYRPDLTLSTTLPQRVKTEPIIPTDEDVKRILAHAKTHNEGKFYVALSLACFGMRKSEIMALTMDDIEGNIVHIRKALVLDENNEMVEKTTKTEASTRDIVIPPELADHIRDQGYIYKSYPHTLNDILSQYERDLGIPHFSLHKLRHFFCSKLASMNVDIETIMAMGGWGSDYCPRNTYRHLKKDKINRAKETAAKGISSAIF